MSEYGWLIVVRRPGDEGGKFRAYHPPSGLTGYGDSDGEACDALRRLLTGTVSPDGIGGGRPVVLSVEQQ